MLIYFHADWNPTCEEIDSKYHDFAVKNGGWTHYKINSDKLQRIKFFYDARYEPMFYLFLNGMLIKRITGFNFAHVQKNMDYTKDAHNGLYEYYPGLKNKWVDYADQVDVHRKRVSSIFQLKIV